MSWNDVLFLHWPVYAEVVAEHLPSELDVDCLNGKAFLGVVAFTMSDLTWDTPVTPSSFGLEFVELNLRTYVRGPEERPGVYFFSLDADHRVAVLTAKYGLGLPYVQADIGYDSHPGSFQLDSQRPAGTAAFSAEWSPSSPVAEKSEKQVFLTERYHFFSMRGTTLLRGRIHHGEWPLQKADVSVFQNDLFTANSVLEPSGDPSVLFSDGVRVRADLPARL